ncbi:hypothetical protein [Jiulongibacter sediminis]|uniref:Lipocalin-like domain-containing protein n=1 Tax=Jiulongibacter sediminis TaxID=1605367 RepID=A0A0P7C0W2_9BACT|nr:hypothetical protein [Jiulongibacter sediminis]KPM47646.1 hypothetical protein AFM12_14285 [Jiulongibacter sediminis]TBX23438.1 hypothetical protein TK44_14295 [Jiulongibacter sediminis]
MMIRKALNLILFVALISCETKEPELPLADQVMGDYTLNSVSDGSASLDLPYVNDDQETISGRVVVTKISDTEVKIVFIVTTETSSIRYSDPEVMEPFTLVKENGVIIGSFNFQNVEFTGENIDLILKYSSGNVLTYSGLKDDE